MESLRAILENLPRAAPATPPTETAPGLAPALAWTLAAGPALAPRARCLGLRDGVLRLETGGDDGLRRQIESVAPELLRALNAMLGPGQVQRIAILG